MGKSYEIGKMNENNMECVNKANEILIDTPSTKTQPLYDTRGSRGLMVRALDLKPEVTQGCVFESWLWQEVSTTEVRPLSKAPNPQLLPGRCNVGCPLLHLDGKESTFHSSLYSV